MPWKKNFKKKNRRAPPLPPRISGPGVCFCVSRRQRCLAHCLISHCLITTSCEANDTTHGHVDVHLIGQNGIPRILGGSGGGEGRSHMTYSHRSAMLANGCCVILMQVFVGAYDVQETPARSFAAREPQLAASLLGTYSHRFAMLAWATALLRGNTTACTQWPKNFACSYLLSHLDGVFQNEKCRYTPYDRKRKKKKWLSKFCGVQKCFFWFVWYLDKIYFCIFCLVEIIFIFLFFSATDQI